MSNFIKDFVEVLITFVLAYAVVVTIYSCSVIYNTVK